MKLNDEIIVDIEKLIFGGDGLARYTDGGAEKNFVVFVKNSLPNEKLKVKIVSVNKKFARGEILEIIEPSKYRIKPVCNLYNACGSCDFQIAQYEYGVQQKTLILKDTFKDIIDINKIYDVIPSGETLGYRRKIQFPARQTKNSKRILLGYFKPKTHELTNIKFCPMQPAVVNDIAQYIRDNFPLDCYDEKKHTGILKNVIFRLTYDVKSVLINFIVNLSPEEFEKNNPKLFKFAKKLGENFNEIKSIYVNLNPEKTNKILGEKGYKLYGEDEIIETLKDKKFYIGSTSFFQVNPSGAVKLFDVVKENILNNSTILDAYGGVGAIGIYAGEHAKKITLVEENKNAILMAKKNFELNNVKNYEILEGDATEHFGEFLEQKRMFDFVILDPPRQGCKKEGLKTISKLAKNIIYVSCNPQTLKRDAALLIDEGFKIEFVQGVDMFPYTHHIECVAKFTK